MHSFDDNKTIDDLIVGYLKNELTADQTKELSTWIRQSHENKRYFDQTRELWITSKALNNNPHYNSEEAFDKFVDTIEKDRPVFLFFKDQWIRIGRIAAIFVLAFLLGGLVFSRLGYFKSSSSFNKFSEIVVPRGAKAHFILQDGTVVTLNAGSKLRYNANFGVEDRVVELEGEAYFKVAKDKARPFIVKTSFLSVRALGTEFNVKAYPGDKTIETTLVEGSVKVAKNGDTEEVILTPNQKLTYYKDESARIDTLDETAENTSEAKAAVPENSTTAQLVKEDVKVEPLVSWKDNRWFIEKQNLSKLAVELERKFDVEIEFKSERLKNFSFTGTLLDEPLEQVLKVMSFTAPLNYEINGKKVIFAEKENFEMIYRKLYEDKKNN